jgi:HK97 family phage portal protein
LSLRTALARAFTRVAEAIADKALVEGSARPGPWSLPATGATWSVGAPSWGGYWNAWQLGGEPWGPGAQMAAVEACKALYAGALASCPIGHFVKLANGGKARIETSDASRIFLSPNSYQSWPDFVGEGVRCLLDDGNFYALAVRNARYEVAELHPMDPRLSFPVVMPETGEIAYALAGNEIIASRQDDLLDYGRSGRYALTPQRDTLHVRLPSYRSARRPTFLVGDSPLVAMLGTDAILRRLGALLDQKHPKAVASIDHVASREQVEELRDRIKEAYGSGSIPIMTGGAKLTPWAGASIMPKDAQLLEFMQFDREEILAAYHVPPALLGLDRASSGTTSELFLLWKQTGLGPLVENIEQRLDKFFKLRGFPHEFIEFDLDSLLRGDEAKRIETLVRALQGGLLSPNEAREREDRPAVPYGGEPRVQQQVVPLSAAASITPGGPIIPPSPPASGTPSAAAIEASDRPRIRKIARLTPREEAEEIERLMREASLRRGPVGSA